MAGVAAAPILIAEEPKEEAWTQVAALPCELSADLLLTDFTLGDLARLEKGTVIDSKWSVGDDIPLRVNGELIAWGEIEVVSSHLALRLTDLA